MVKARYRLKTYEIEAEQLTKENAEELTKWCGGQIVEETNPLNKEEKFVGINVPTLQGNKRLSEGDYLVQRGNGAFVVLDRQYHENMYEKVDDGN